MKKINLTENEKNKLRSLYESHGIILFEDNVLGYLARKAMQWVGKNEDEIMTLFRTSESALAKNIDDIVANAVKSKSLNALDDLQAKLMHYYNPSNLAENIPAAQQNVKKLLNGFAKSRNKDTWKAIRDSVTGAERSAGSAQSAGAASTGAARPVYNAMKGRRVSNRWEWWTPEYIDFSKFSNQMSMDELNKQIATAIQTKNWILVPRKGFEKFGIDDFRKHLQDDILKINEVDPLTGRWSVIFK